MPALVRIFPNIIESLITMKVLFSTQSIVEYDGVHYYSNPIQATYKRYLTLGDRITVLCHVKKVEISHSDMIDDDAVEFCFINKINSLKSLIHYSKLNREVIESQVRDSDVCVIHTQNAHAFQVAHFCKKYEKPYLTVVGACPWDALWNYDWRGKIVAPIAWLQLRRIQKDAHFSIYVTKEFLQKRYPTQGRTICCSNVNIHTGIDWILENRITKISNLKDNGRFIKIGTAAAVDVPYKGQKYVIQALGILKQKGIIMEYHLIGKGSNSRLKRIAQQEGVESQVFFHGAIPHSAVLQFLDEIDVYCQPSKQEGLPRALIEAMSRGCYCMGSDVAGIPELLDPFCLFKKGDVNGIATLLIQVSQEKLLNSAKSNFEKAKEYDMDLLNNKRSSFIDLFRKEVLIKTRKR